MADKITPLGGGEVGLDANLTGDAEMLQTEVSRNNYRATTTGDLQQFKVVVRRMVSKWAREDMLRIIQEYGDYQFIAGKKNVSDEVLRQQVTETLIIRLSKKDLKQILNQQNSETSRMMNDIKKSNTNAARRAKRYFNMNTFAATYENIKYVSNNKMFMKGIKAQEKSFRVAKGTVRLFPSLRKELLIILKGFDKVSLVHQALSMGIDFPEGSSERTVIDMIINKCVLYVSLILGKSKGGLGNVQIDTVKGIEELLSMTSFAYVTGSPGLSNKEIRNKRELAKSAKARMKANERIQAETKGGKFTAVQRFFTSKKKYAEAEDWQNAAQKGKLSSEFLTINNITQLKEMAYRFGINADDSKYKKDTSKLVFDLNRAIKATQKQGFRSLMTGDEATANELFGRFDKGAKDREKIFQTETDKVPIVNFDGSGNLISAKIKSAVPVIIVGNTTPGDKEANIKKVKYHFNSKEGKVEGIEIGSEWGKILGLMGESASEERIKTLQKKFNFLGKKPTKKLVEKLRKEFDKLAAEDKKIEYEKKIEKRAAEILDEVKNKPDTPKEEDKQTPITEVSDVKIPDEATKGSEIGIEVNASASAFVPQYDSVKGKFDEGLIFKQKQKKVMTEEEKSEFLKRMREGKKKKAEEKEEIKNKLLYFKDNFNDPIKKAKYRYIAPVHEMLPMYIANKGFDDFADLIKAGGNIQSDVGQIKNWISTNLPILFGGLQMGGSAYNAASVAASSVGLSANIQQQIIDAIDTKLKSSTGYATGGTGKAMKKFASGATASGYRTSSFITGDSINGKPNEEMVNIDWNSKTFSVKPVNRDRGSADGISNITRMTTAERNGPMTVSISSGLVKYNKGLNGAADDGSGTALKVYAVNGLNESIVVNGEEVNPISLIAGIYTKLTSIEALTASSTQLLSSIATNTAKTASNTVQKNADSRSSFTGFPEGITMISQGF